MTRPKKFIVTAVGVGACAGVALHLIKLHGQPTAESAQRVAFHAVTTGYPGNGTPEKTLQSLGWAAEKGNLELLRTNVTPEIQEMLHEAGPNMTTHAISVATELGGGKVLKKEVLSDGQILLQVQSAGRDNPWSVRMQKIDGNWKLAGLEP